MNEAWLLSTDGCGGRAGALLPPAGVECLGCGRAEPAPAPACPNTRLASQQPWVQAGLSGTCKGASPGPGLGGEEHQLGRSVGMVQWCQPCSQNWVGRGRAGEERETFSFHTWETVKSQVATPAFVWHFQKNPAGPGIPGHNLLWKNKIIKYQSL